MEAVVVDNKIRTELVFIPTPAVGHLVSAVEMAKQLVDRHDRLSITILAMEDLFGGHLKTSTFAASLLPSNSKHAALIRFVDIPPPPSRNDVVVPLKTHSSPTSYISHFVHSHIPQLRVAVSQLLVPAITGSSSSLGGLVLDMFLAPMVDIADELGVPSYIFFTSGV